MIITKYCNDVYLAELFYSMGQSPLNFNGQQQWNKSNKQKLLLFMNEIFPFYSELWFDNFFLKHQPLHYFKIWNKSVYLNKYSQSNIWFRYMIQLGIAKIHKKNCTHLYHGFLGPSYTVFFLFFFWLFSFILNLVGRQPNKLSCQ